MRMKINKKVVTEYFHPEILRSFKRRGMVILLVSLMLTPPAWYLDSQTKRAEATELQRYVLETVPATLVVVGLIASLILLIAINRSYKNEHQ